MRFADSPCHNNAGGLNGVGRRTQAAFFCTKGKDAGHKTRISFVRRARGRATKRISRVIGSACNRRDLFRGRLCARQLWARPHAVESAALTPFKAARLPPAFRERLACVCNKTVGGAEGAAVCLPGQPPGHPFGMGIEIPPLPTRTGQLVSHSTVFRRGIWENTGKPFPFGESVWCATLSPKGKAFLPDIKS